MMAPPSLKSEVIALLPSKEVAELPKVKSNGAGTIKEMARLMEVWEPTVRRHLRALRKEHKAHIANWHRSPNGFIAVWALGDFPDVPQPVARSVATMCKMYRRRVRKAVQNAKEGKSYDETYKRHVARAMADKVVQQTRVTPQNPFSALFI